MTLINRTYRTYVYGGNMTIKSRKTKKATASIIDGVRDDASPAPTPPAIGIGLMVIGTTFIVA
tara:strand:+ start:21221 stop:21409 length:189 start_codon:yes stop_codon:yes gene_type:complete